MNPELVHTVAVVLLAVVLVVYEGRYAYKSATAANKARSARAAAEQRG